MIAIHKSSTGFFSDYWIIYCDEYGIEYKLVNCYDSDIVSQLKNCSGLLWHHSHYDYRDLLFAKHLIFSLQLSGLKVFPDFNTTWHFNDKIAQKYLLESAGAPLVKSYIFYSREKAIEWVKCTEFPKVFKLRSGAGGANVQLIKKKSEALHRIGNAFGKGFPPFDRLGNLKDRYNKFRSGKDTLTGVIKGIGRLFIPIKNMHLMPVEKGYVYFQDYIPDNEHDIRVIIIGDKAFAIKRMVRKGDFRASGSGNIIYDKNEIETSCIKIAFKLSEKLNFQCMAYDFVFDQHNNPLLLEISYGFSPTGYTACPGYWDHKMNWIEGNFNPYGWMVEFILK